MTNYLSTSVFVIIFIAFAETVTVSGKNGRAVKTVLSLVAVVSFISPIFTLINGDVTYQVDDNNAEYTSYLLHLEKTTLETEILTLLNVNGYNVNSVDVEVDAASDIISTKKVDLILNCQGINCENTHINIIEEIKKLLTERVFGDGSGVVIDVGFNEI